MGNSMNKVSGMVLAAVLLAAGAVQAQNYPCTRPVRILVGYTPGGGVDTTARMMAQALGELWGGNVLVENRPGAAGNIATEATAKAPPDGYTMVLCNIGSHAITPARFAKRLTYDPIGDFAFPIKIGGVPNIFMVHPSLPIRNLQQYIDYARKNPGKLNYGSSGVGASPHLSIELLKSMTGINIVHVPYKGAAPALADAMSGHMESSVGNLAGAPLAAGKSRLRPPGDCRAWRGRAPCAGAHKGIAGAQAIRLFAPAGGAVARSRRSSHLIACSRESPHISGPGARPRQKAGRSGWPKMRQRLASSSCTQRTPAGLPPGMPGMAELIDGAMQQAPQPGRQCMRATGVRAAP